MLDRTIVRLAWFLALSALASAAMPTPREFGAGARSARALATTDGEQFCWHATGAAEAFLRGYEATGDVRWLEEAQRYYDFLLGKLTRDPDGWEGWIGRTIRDGAEGQKYAAYRTDALVGDALLLAPMVRFAEIVRGDSALQKRFGAVAAHYVERARRIGWEKWNARGNYYRDALGFGSYRTSQRLIDAQTGQWVESPVPRLSENLNKHTAMAIVVLRLWRVTGEPEFRQRAVEIFSRLKLLFRYYPEDDRVTWNFWMPHGPYDLGEGKLRRWVGVHALQGAYQAQEVARMVEAYDSGIVFDEADLRRLIHANHYMRPQEPGGKWRSSDGATNAGYRWSALARFDPEIRTSLREPLRVSRKPQDRIELAYDDRVTARHLGWSRRFVNDQASVSVFVHPPQPGAQLTATVVIPNQLSVGSGDRVTLVTQTARAGELVIELLAEKGETVLGELGRHRVGERGAVLLPTWEGTLPGKPALAPGLYRVRWRLNEESRTEGLLITGESRAAPAP